MKNVILIVVAFSMLFVVPASATIINVPADQPNIQAGINASSNGDTVRVAGGTYVENINFSGKNIVVSSWFLDAGDPSYISSTIIDGNQSGSVVSFLNGEDNTAVITGFTIQNGLAQNGGGIYCDYSSPTINYNTISGNSAGDYGGGIHCYESSPTISNNTISGNSTYLGGGIGCLSSSPTISNNTINGNSAHAGGGINCAYFSPTISNNTISGNTAGDYGGGIFCKWISNATISNNTICGNTAGDYGGGIECQWISNATISNNTICGNTAGDYGGGIYCLDSSPVITNTIFWGDSAPTGPEIYLCGPSSPVITYCDIQGGWAGDGNIDCDPMFCDPENGNFYLDAASCCVGAGEGGVDIGAFGVGCGEVGYQYLPGDCNMFNGDWPPEVNTSDLLRLLLYLGVSGAPYEPCFMYNSSVPEPRDSLFYAAADVNGDCNITGSDITYLMAYLEGLHPGLEFCPYYPPAWLSEDDLPQDPPLEWPECQEPPEWDYAEPFESSPDPDVVFWFGHPDSSSIHANIGEIFAVDVYVQTSDSTCGGDIHVPLGLNELYGSFADSGEYHYPFTEWDGHGFIDPVDSPPNQPGWSSISFMGWRTTSYPTDNPCLNSDVPIKILTFYIEAVNDSDLVDSTINCLAVGAHPAYWTLSVGDTLGLSSYPVAVNIIPVTFSEKTYFYLPGDINMYYGFWPPARIGSDFDCLINYFRLRPGGDPCYLYNPQAPKPPDTLFWASADVNGDCKITGSDPIYWYHWMRGYHPTLQHCPYYPPAWLTEDDIPPDPPMGWPYCNEPPAEVYVDPFESSPDPEATFWFGNPDSSSIPAVVGETFAVDIYIQTSVSTYAGDFHVPLGVKNQYISSFADSGDYYYPMTEWYDAPAFLEPQGSPPNQPGWSSKSVHGWSNVTDPYTDPWLHSTTPIKILTFYATAINDTNLIDSTIFCLDVGGHPTFGSLDLGDMWGLGSLPIAANILPVKFERKTYEYLPGDVNMALAIWPPSVIGGDVTYLVGYFIGGGQAACLLNGFWCSADINGDCLIIGGDVTALVGYFVAGGSLVPCPDYEPAWPPVPDNAPAGWPNCDTPVINSRVIPTGSVK